MLSHCLKRKQNTESIDPKVSGTSNVKTMTLSKCAICGSKKSKFIKNQETERLLDSLDLNTPLNRLKNDFFK